MSLAGQDFATDRDQIAAFIANRAPELSTSPDKFAGELAGALGQLAQSIGGDVERVSADWPPSADSSPQGLTDCAIAIGLSNGAGGYGPRGATKAQGMTAPLTGDAGTAYLAGQQATAGGVTIELRTGVTIPGVSGSGQIDGTWDAVTEGVAGNVAVGTVLTLISPPGTSDPEVTVTAAATIEGKDAESESSKLTRILNKMQRPPNGGNGTDYKEWSENATDTAGNPVTTTTLTAHVYPNYDGTGSPLAVVLQSGSGTGRKISEPLRAAIETSVNGTTTTEGQRPVSHDFVVKTGYMPAARALVIRCRTVPSLPKYAYDWVRGATSYTVNSTTATGLPSWATSAGANFVLELNTLAPASLKDAITAGAQPRLQVHYLNGTTIQGPVVPEQWPALAYQDAAGRTSIALLVPNATLAGTWAQVGNQVYSGSVYVPTIAAAILRNAVDGIGPSRVSGLADRAQIWQDVVGSSTVSTAAENATDEDQITRLITRCVAGAVTIGIGGGGALSVQDVQASDNTINGPEVLYAGRILVTD